MAPDAYLQLLPIAISIFALVISVLSLGWNVYRDVVLKPRLKVKFNLNYIIHPTFPSPVESLILKATNFGPGVVNCRMIQLRNAPLWRRLIRKVKYAVLVHDFENILSGKLPTKLEVGEAVDLMIRWEKGCFLKEPYTHIGLSDSFGRTHWAPKRDVANTREKYNEKFLKKT